MVLEALLGKSFAISRPKTTPQKPLVVKINAHANGLTFLIHSGSPCHLYKCIYHPKDCNKYHVNLPQLQGADYSHISSDDFDQTLKTLQQLQSAQAQALDIMKRLASNG